MGIKTKAIEVRYATLKAVQNFFGTKATAVSFPTEFDKTDADQALFLKALKALQGIAPNKNGERQIKPIFSFGRFLIKMSKNAENFALSQCTIYITEYPYDLGGGKTENRVQVVVAPPMDNSDINDIDIDDDSWLGTVPQSNKDTDAFDEDDAE